ncbi:MAG: TolC family protein [Desulfovibrionaceae bacterium]
MKSSLTRLVLAAMLVLAAAMPAMALDATEYDMEKSVNTALANNPQIKSAQSDVEAAEFNRKSAWAPFAPALSSSYGYTLYDHKQTLKDSPLRDRHLYSATLTLSQDIFTGFKNVSNYDKAKLEKATAEVSVSAQELDLTLAVQQAFLGLLKGREAVRSAQDSITRLESQLKVTQAFYDVGLKPRLDVLQAEVNLAEAQDTLLKAQNEVATQNTRLNTLLIIPVESDVRYVGDLTEVPFTYSLQDCLERAFRLRPDLSISQTAIEIAKKSADVTKSGLYPSVTGDANYNRQGDDPAMNGYEHSSSGFSSWNVQVGASWSVFNWGETWYAWKKAQQAVRKAELDLETLKQNVLYDVKTKHLSILSAAERIKVARKALDSAQESYRMAVARYQAQVGTNTDVLDGQANLSSAEAQLTEALADYKIALANLYVSIGMKNPTLLAAQ